MRRCQIKKSRDQIINLSGQLHVLSSNDASLVVSGECQANLIVDPGDLRVMLHALTERSKSIDKVQSLQKVLELELSMKSSLALGPGRGRCQWECFEVLHAFLYILRTQ